MTFSLLGIDTETNERVTIPKASRLQGLYIIGIQGTGKSGLIENLIVDDIKQGTGIAVLDPHGDLISAVLARLDRREEDVILLDITDYHFPFGVNLFTCSDLTSPIEVQKTADQVMHVFEKIYGVSRDTPLILDYLRNCTATLIANPGYTMAEIPLLLLNAEHRKKLVANVTDSDVRLFWQQYEQMKPNEQHEQAAYIRRRVAEFLLPLSRPIVGQSASTIDVQRIMDEGKILLVKLSTQLPSVTSLIGSVFIALILTAASARPANKRRQFHLYADEFQRFATEDFATLLEEARKFGIGITIAHQNRGQLELGAKQADANLKQRTLSVGNLIVFRVPTDAEELAGKFDYTPQRTKKVLKQRTEPVYREWDEYYWDTNEAERQYSELEQHAQEAWKQQEQAVLRAICAQALADHFRQALSKQHYHTDSFDTRSVAQLVSDLKRCDVDEAFQRSALYKNDLRQAIHSYLSHPLNSFWLMPDGTLRSKWYSSSSNLGWTEESLHAVEHNLTLRDMKSETVHNHFYYWPDWWNGKSRTRDRKRVDYSYLNQEEWYSFTNEAAISGLEYVLRNSAWPDGLTRSFPLWKGVSYSGLVPRKPEVDALFRTLLDELITEVRAFVMPVYTASQLKFYPQLAPELPWDRAKRDNPSCSDGWSSPDDGAVVYSWLAQEPQPTIGQRRNTSGYTSWMECGRWELLTFAETVRTDGSKREGAASWLVHVETYLQERVMLAEKAVAACETARQQFLDEQQACKRQHYKAAHRREYLGEQPVKEQQFKDSRTTDVQWYDYQEELDQTFDQRRDEIANELVQLPPYTARVKVATEKGLVEHTIKTLDPKQQPGKSLLGQALQERLARIKARNMHDGYVRKREDVEREIAERQSALTKREPLKPRTTSDEDE